MKPFRSAKIRIFVICWLVYTLHFSTNVVREHYPAFSLIDQGNFQVDEYLGFHSDIFRHTDGHAYIGNNVAGSLPAVPGLLIFDPVLDRLEDYRLKHPSGGGSSVYYDTEYPNRAGFLRKVKERGLDLRFGAATFITTFTCQAPLAALLVVLIYGLLLKRGLRGIRAVSLAFLFAFGTPVFYRAAHLNHNLFFALVLFGSFLLLWKEDGVPVTRWRRFFAGLLAGAGLALDYAGALTLLVLYGYLVLARRKDVGLLRAIGESLIFVLGSIPPVAFLLWTQWWMYGNPFLPGQFHMPDVNYTEMGVRGMTLPDPSVFYENLMSPDWGLIPFAPMFVLLLVPALYRKGKMILPRREGVFVAVFTLAFLLFCAANQYSLMQFNSGFRYLLPVVPFLFLALSDHFARMPTWLLFLVGAPSVIHGWVLAMTRFTRPEMASPLHAVPESWRRVLHEGLQLPWLNVLRGTTPDPDHIVHWAIWPFFLLLCTGLVCFWVWRRGPRVDSVECTQPLADG